MYYKIQKYLVITLLLPLNLLSCQISSNKVGDIKQVTKECFSANDERSYLEMTEYLVLNDTGKINQMVRKGKITKLKAKRKVKILKKKMDMMFIEFNGSRGKSKGWVASKMLT